MGKKKFIDKKNSATFHLLARDSGENDYFAAAAESSANPSGDRVFVRVDNSQYSADTFFPEDDEVFADADESAAVSAGGLPENVRREILELGFPDDGYNYLLHMREIKNNGGGSFYYHNTKAKLDDLPDDIKAYDASKVEIAKVSDEPDEKIIYTVASKTVGVRIQKAVDAEVAALLDDDDLSRFASDDDEFEDDFVIQGNLLDEVDNDEFDNKLSLAENSGVIKGGIGEFIVSHPRENTVKAVGESSGNENQRVRRYLDEQFDMLEQQEYGTDSEDEYGYFAPEEDNHVSLAEKLGPIFKDHIKEDIVLDDQYKAPADLLHEKENSEKNTEPVVSAAVILQRCKEYGKGYEQDEDPVFEEEESSDEAEVWDCESIVSTYSNLDNHPGKIVVPNARRKKKLVQTVTGVLAASNNIITLKGKERIPVDYLPNSKKAVAEKVKVADNVVKEPQKRKQHGQESKEEKKERKSAVKEERREARKIKKETKVIYKSEGQRAQKVSAFTGPSSIHLM